MAESRVRKIAALGPGRSPSHQLGGTGPLPSWEGSRGLPGGLAAARGGKKGQQCHPTKLKAQAACHPPSLDMGCVSAPRSGQAHPEGCGRGRPPSVGRATIGKFRARVPFPSKRGDRNQGASGTSTVAPPARVGPGAFQDRPPKSVAIGQAARGEAPHRPADQGRRSQG